MVFRIESIEKLNNREHGDALKKNARQHITTDLSDLMVLDGHSSITILCQMRDRCKRKASDEPGERPNKIIMTEIAKQDTTDLLPGDVKSGRQAIYRRLTEDVLSQMK
jgi:hypothetical protein